jgi:hypothetical protein
VHTLSLAIVVRSENLPGVEHNDHHRTMNITQGDMNDNLPVENTMYGRWVWGVPYFVEDFIINYLEDINL